MIGQFELSLLRLLSTCEGMLFVAEQDRLQKIFRNRRTVQRDERLVGAGRVAVQIARYHLLAGAGFAGQQHGGIGVGDAPRHGQQLQGARVLRNRVAVVRGTQMPGNAGNQIARPKRLRQVVDRPILHRPHGTLDRAVRRHHHHRRAVDATAQGRQQGKAIHPRQIDICDDQRDSPKVDACQCRFSAGHDNVRVLRQAQGLTQSAGERGIVLHDEHTAELSHSSSVLEQSNCQSAAAR